MSNLAEGIAPDHLIAQGSADLPTPPLCQGVSGFHRTVGVGWRTANGGAERTRSHQPLTLTGRGKLPYSPLFHPSGTSGTRARSSRSGNALKPPPE
jgi:hypothetical protein